MFGILDTQLQNDGPITISSLLSSRIVAVGTGQRVRGFIEGDTRPNLIIVDDYESN